MLDIILLALIGGIGISIVTAIFGNFMVWRKVSYIGDAIGHSSLFGIAIGLLFGSLSVFWVFLACILFSIILVIIKYFFSLSKEALIVFNTQLFIALGLILMSLFYVSNGTNTLSYLFGDILLLTYKEVIVIFLITLLVIVYVFFFWKELVLITISEEIAYSENVKVFLNEIFFMSFLSVTIAFLVKFVGVFLIPSLLVIPALIANIFVKNPVQSFVISSITSFLAIVLGLFLSFLVNVAVSPLITIVISLEFLIILGLKYCRLINLITKY